MGRKWNLILASHRVSLDWASLLMAKRKKKRKKIQVKHSLVSIGVYETIKFEDAEQIVADKSEYTQFFFELEHNPGSCGCYYSCECVNAVLHLYGQRIETDAEFETRKKEEDEKSKEFLDAHKARELAEQKRLNKKYPKAK